MVDIYQMITGKIISLLEAGVVPWRQPWTGSAPTNLLSKKEYQGINALLLGCMPFESSYWLTYRQAQKLGGAIRAGERSPAFVVFTDTYLVNKQKKSKNRKRGTAERL